MGSDGVDLGRSAGAACATTGGRGGRGLSDAQRPGKADLHVHTAISDGMASPRQVLEYVEAETDLDIIAITDHDGPRGAMETRET